MTAGVLKIALTIIALIIVLALAALFLLPQVLSGNTFKTKPTLSGGEPVTKEHVEWIVNELSTMNIRSKYFKNRLEVEFIITPDNGRFTAFVDNGIPTTRAGEALDPDIRLTVGRDSLARLLSEDDFFAEVRKLNDEGVISMETRRSAEELEAMGYPGIYEELTG